MWIIEAVPKNPYYIYGKRIVYVDKGTFRGHGKSRCRSEPGGPRLWLAPGLGWPRCLGMGPDRVGGLVATGAHALRPDGGDER